MSPASNEHSFRQSKLIREILNLTEEGEVLPECSIDTDEGTKVADVVWFSAEFHATHGLATPYPTAPELCIEVLSPSNTTIEMEEKRRLYFDQGAIEVWMCDLNGNIRFYNAVGPIEGSSLIKGFPGAV